MTLCSFASGQECAILCIIFRCQQSNLIRCLSSLCAVDLCWDDVASQITLAILGVLRPIEKHGSLCLLHPAGIRGCILTIFTSYDMFVNTEVFLGVTFILGPILMLLLARLMGQYCFARWHLSSSVTLPAGRVVRRQTLYDGPVVLRPVRAISCLVTDKHRA